MILLALISIQMLQTVTFQIGGEKNPTRVTTHFLKTQRPHLFQIYPFTRHPILYHTKLWPKPPTSQAQGWQVHIIVQYILQH